MFCFSSNVNFQCIHREEQCTLLILVLTVSVVYALG